MKELRILISKYVILITIVILIFYSGTYWENFTAYTTRESLVKPKILTTNTSLKPLLPVKKENSPSECLLDKTCFNRSTTESCHRHKYNLTNILQCLQDYTKRTKKYPYLAFMGDSRTGQLYFHFRNTLKHFATKLKYINAYTYLKIDCDYLTEHDKVFTVPSKNAKFNFFWRNFADERAINLVKHWYKTCKSNRNSSECPWVVVANIMAHELVPCIPERWSLLKRYLSRIKPFLDEFNKLSEVGVIAIWKSSNPTIDNLYKPNTIYQIAFENERMKLWNKEVEKLLKKQPNIHLWNSGETFVLAKRKACIALPKDKITVAECGKDGHHHSDDVIEAELQLFLNYLCNRFLQRDGKTGCS